MNHKVELDEDKIQNGLEEACSVLEIEAESVIQLKNSIDHVFKKAVKMIIECEGRVVFVGMGKSGLIAQKLAATFSSTGTPAFFVHAGEALHGDLGMITENDVVIAVSNSGETEEIVDLLPAIKRLGAGMISLTGDRSSTLAKYSDLCIFSGVEEEACPYGLAPTASTTATLALGDALAISLSYLKGFTKEDFALFHPGGSLGRKLLTKVSDVLEIRQQNPVVTLDTTVREALFTMTESKMGSTSVVDNHGNIRGIITDGDIRRLLEDEADFIDRSVSECMTEDPTVISKDKLAAEALKLMEDKEINDLPVIEEGKPIGMLNFQDLLRAKVF
ncbi:MAG: KpsF/GutQ family sugar-phosphate isomerase [Halanaerobiales bacterium]